MNRIKFTGKSVAGDAENHGIRPNFAQMSNSELLYELEEKLSAMDEDSFDFEIADSYLKELQDRAPVMTEYDPESEWVRLNEKHPLIFEDDIFLRRNVCSGKRDKTRAVRILRIAEIAAAVVLCLTISANAFNFNPLKLLLNWAEEILQIQGNASGVMELPENSGSQYRSLEDALNKNKVSPALCPTWIPEDYKLVDVSAKSSESLTSISAYYAAPRGDLFIRIIKNYGQWAESSEKSPGGYIYESSGHEYYIITNFEVSKAGWADGSCSYTIEGKISENELKKMIDSIGGN